MGPRGNTPVMCTVEHLHFAKSCGSSGGGFYILISKRAREGTDASLKNFPGVAHEPTGNIVPLRWSGGLAESGPRVLLNRGSERKGL